MGRAGGSVSIKPSGLWHFDALRPPYESDAQSKGLIKKRRSADSGEQDKHFSDRYGPSYPYKPWC